MHSTSQAPTCRSRASSSSRRRARFPAQQAACIGSRRPLATWVMALEAAGSRSNVPMFLLPGAQPPARARVHRDLPAASGRPGRHPRRATFGAKLYSAQLTINGVFGTVAGGAWIASWAAVQPGVGTEHRRRRRIAGSDRPGRSHPRGEEVREGAASARPSPGASRRPARDAAPPSRSSAARAAGAEVARPRAGRGERRLHVQGEGGDVLPGHGGAAPGAARRSARSCSR